MEDQFLKLKQKVQNLKDIELMDEVSDLVIQILDIDKSMLSVQTKQCGHGTWKASVFANKSYFGDELAGIIEDAISGRKTHDEDKQFEVSDFEERLNDEIYENLYFS